METLNKMQMSIKEKILKEYNDAIKMESEIDCYMLRKRRYIVFWERIIKVEDIRQILDKARAGVKKISPTQWNTIIIVGETSERFDRKDLFFSDNVDTHAVFVLYNENDGNVYTNTSTVAPLGTGFKKYTNKIKELLM